MRRAWFLLFFCVAGCIANNGLGSAATADKNIWNLSRLWIGMSSGEVLRVMRQPYSRRAFQIGDDSYDVWFYVTRGTILGQSRLVPQNLTPLTFKNDALIGWGFDYYNYLLKKEAAPKAAPTEEKESEDSDLEKALQKKTSAVSMSCSKPAQKPPAAAEPPEEDPPEYPLDDQDRKMQEEESEQNFNYW